jgi:beta-lactam-binding protein with PASTA domain
VHKFILRPRHVVLSLSLLILAACGGGSGGGSAPSAQVLVPNVVGLTSNAAGTAITGAALGLGTVTTASSATVASGSIISETPAAGTMVAPNSDVSVVVSSGPAPVSVPNVVGMTQASATASLTGVGLVVGTVTTAISATVTSGSVISENPASGSMVGPGSAVNLTISSGPTAAQVAVPNVVGLTQAAATTAITAAGLIVGEFGSSQDSTVPYGTVAGEYPAAGTAVATGSAVNITVSSGSPSVPATVPKVVGLTQATASTAITIAGVVVGTVTTASSLTVASGSVTSQTPPATTSVPPGTTVNLILSSGAATPGFAYVANGEGTISAYSRNSTTGALTALNPATITVIQSPPTPGVLSAIAIDPFGKFLYALGYYDNNGFVSGGIYAYVINANGSLSVVPGSPFVTNGSPQAMVFDSSGSYAYVSSASASTVSGYSLDPATGALEPLPQSPYGIGVPAGAYQLVRVGNTVYADTVDNINDSIVTLFIIPGPDTLSSTGIGAPFPTNSSASSLFVNPPGSVLFALTQVPPADTSFSLLAFNIDASTGFLTPFASPLLTTSSNSATLDPSGQFLFLTNQTTGLEVYPINTLSGAIGNAIAGSPFATSANQSNALPSAVSFDSTGNSVFVVNSGSQSLSGGASSGGGIAEFAFNNSTGTLTPVAGSPVTAGANPVAIAIR